MNTRLFALFGAVLLAGVALGPAAAAAQSTDAGNDSTAADSFGQQVSAMVEDLRNSTNGTGIGHAVSTFVVANNPGNAPAFAGSPGGPNATENDSQGPPAFVQSLIGNGDDANETSDDDTSVDDRRGPPEHAGGPGAANQTAADGNVTDADANQSAGPGNGQGPPDHAGGDDDDSDDGDDRGNGGGNGQGPPDDAGPR